jgi:beta-glucosidase
MRHGRAGTDESRASDGTIRFPEGFLWGSAISAHQVEGGNRWNDWWRFEEQGRVHGGERSGDACRHYQLFDSDFALAAADHHGALRLSIEWSRIQPEPGRTDDAAVLHYHEVLASLSRHGLRPLVTLHHFTNPLWIADRGGWESRETIDRFSDFVRFCAREYGREVDWWCTVNEPEVLAFRAYSEGVWPPAKKDDSGALAVMANLLEAHGRAYAILKDEDRWDADGDGEAARVGFAKHCPQLEPLRRWSPLDVLRARFEDDVFNRAVLEAPITGEIRLGIPGARGVRRKVQDLAGSLDYIGLNYYTRWMVCATGPKVHVARPGARLTDLEWEIYAEGLERALLRVGALGRPVLVTEHGFADAADAFRPQALVEGLARMARAIARGVPVRGYFHWSLLDNFEWSDGFGPRFGLYGVDYTKPERPRARRASAGLYARIVQANAITPDVAREAGVASLTMD